MVGMMTLVDSIWLCLMEFLGFLDKGGERHTHCNALALNRMGSRLLPCEDTGSWLVFAGFLEVFGHSWRQAHTLQRSGPHQDGLKTFAL